MKSLQWVSSVSAIAAVAVAAGCTHMNKEEGTAAGAGGGAVAGAVVGGPVGAVVGGVGGAVVGHETAKGAPSSSDRTNTASTSRSMGDTSYVRSVQQALNSRGYNAGTPDGRWGPGTEEALRQFQRSQGMQATGQLDARTAAALGV